MKYLILLVLCGGLFFTSSCVKKAIQNPDKSVTLIYDTLRLVTGTTQQLSSQNFTASELKWSSTDSSIVSIDANGLVSAKKVGNATINVKSTAASVTATCAVVVTDNSTGVIGNTPSLTFNSASIGLKATDIGIGADGTVFLVGADTLTTGGHSISKYVNGTLTKLPDCGAMRVAVSPSGIPWVVDYAKHIRRYNGNSWDVISGNATDIGIGADSSVFAVGKDTVSYTGGYNIMQWKNNAWVNMADCAGLRIAVNPKGIPLVSNKANIVYQYTGNYLWTPFYGVAATDIGVGADGSIFTAAVNLSSGSTGSKLALYKLVASNWTLVRNAQATNVAVSPQGRVWWIDGSKKVHVQLR